MKEDKSKYIAFDLKTWVGNPSDSIKNNNHVRKFEQGSPQKLIDIIKEIETEFDDWRRR